MLMALQAASRSYLDGVVLGRIYGDPYQDYCVLSGGLAKYLNLADVPLIRPCLFHSDLQVTIGEFNENVCDKIVVDPAEEGRKLWIHQSKDHLRSKNLSWSIPLLRDPTTRFDLDGFWVRQKFWLASASEGKTLELLRLLRQWKSENFDPTSHADLYHQIKDCKWEVKHELEDVEDVKAAALHLAYFIFKPLPGDLGITAAMTERFLKSTLLHGFPSIAWEVLEDADLTKNMNMGRWVDLLKSKCSESKKWLQLYLDQEGTVDLNLLLDCFLRVLTKVSNASTEEGDDHWNFALYLIDLVEELPQTDPHAITFDDEASQKALRSIRDRLLGMPAGSCSISGGYWEEDASLLLLNILRRWPKAILKSLGELELATNSNCPSFMFWAFRLIPASMTGIPSLIQAARGYLDSFIVPKCHGKFKNGTRRNLIRKMVGVTKKEPRAILEAVEFHLHAHRYSADLDMETSQMLWELVRKVYQSCPDPSKPSSTKEHYLFRLARSHFHRLFRLLLPGESTLDSAAEIVKTLSSHDMHCFVIAYEHFGLADLAGPFSNDLSTDIVRCLQLNDGCQTWKLPADILEHPKRQHTIWCLRALLYYHYGVPLDRTRVDIDWSEFDEEAKIRCPDDLSLQDYQFIVQFFVKKYCPGAMIPILMAGQPENNCPLI